MFLAGAKNLEANKEWINELNVFPVPDGDTGTNMTLTIMSAAKEVGSAGKSGHEDPCQRQFLPVLYEEPEETPESFFPSFSEDLPKASRITKEIRLR